jgi:hypothetical protein
MAKAGMGVAAADIDDDRDLDLLVVNLTRETDSFYRNQGSYFHDDTAAAGLAAVTRQFTRFGAGWLDFNNDGWLDVFEACGRVRRIDETVHRADDVYAEPNILFRGSASGRFEEVLPRGGTDPVLIHTSRAAAFGDIDNDGGVDILVNNKDGPAYLLRNVVKERGRWIMFRVLDEHERDAIGATVRLRLGERTISRDVRTAYSYCATNDPRVHVGLGDAARVEEVTVRWVDGAVESFGGYEANRIVELRRGSGAPAKGVEVRSR